MQKRRQHLHTLLIYMPRRAAKCLAGCKTASTYFLKSCTNAKRETEFIASVSLSSGQLARSLSYFKRQAVCALLLRRIGLMRPDCDTIQRAQILCVLVMHALVHRTSDGLVTTMTHFTSLLYFSSMTEIFTKYYESGSCAIAKKML